ncbi:MAG: hypothetical protein RSD35_05445 [Oscillospiraceae bacterium]
MEQQKRTSGTNRGALCPNSKSISEFAVRRTKPMHEPEKNEMSAIYRKPAEQKPSVHERSNEGPRVLTQPERRKKESFAPLIIFAVMFAILFAVIISLGGMLIC